MCFPKLVMDSTNMNLWSSCNLERPDEAALDTPYTSPVMQESDAPHPDGRDQPLVSCIFSTENRKPENDSIIRETLQQNEPCSSSRNQSYIEKIKEFQFYIDTVKRFTRPGCSADTLDVALSSMSSLINTLSSLSSKQHVIRASL